MLPAPSFVQGLVENARDSLGQLWLALVDTFPNVVEGLIVLVVGWIGTRLFSWLLGEVVAAKQARQPGAVASRKTFLQKVRAHCHARIAFDAEAKWFIGIAFLVSAVNVIGLVQIKNFLLGLLNYVPNVIIGGLVTLAGIALANFIAKLIESSEKTTGTPHQVS